MYSTNRNNSRSDKDVLFKSSIHVTLVSKSVRSFLDSVCGSAVSLSFYKLEVLGQITPALFFKMSEQENCTMRMLDTILSKIRSILRYARWNVTQPWSRHIPSAITDINFKM